MREFHYHEWDVAPLRDGEIWVRCTRCHFDRIYPDGAKLLTELFDFAYQEHPGGFDSLLQSQAVRGAPEVEA